MQIRQGGDVVWTVENGWVSKGRQVLRSECKGHLATVLCLLVSGEKGDSVSNATPLTSRANTATQPRSTQITSHELVVAYPLTTIVVSRKDTGIGN